MAQILSLVLAMVETMALLLCLCRSMSLFSAFIMYFSATFGRYILYMGSDRGVLYFL